MDKHTREELSALEKCGFLAPIGEEPLNAEELTMRDFLRLCQPSLSPDSYEQVICICDELSLARQHLLPESTQRCIDEIGEWTDVATNNN